jgi:hypothetical protein
MLQSYSGTLRLFPNTHNLGRARFKNLRAAGAFLVSAAYDGKTVSPVTLLSEKGVPVRLANPWKTAGIRAIRLKDGKEISARNEGEVFVFSTEPGARYRIEPA